ncbi:hypothetical protein [Candidatus Palauibacter sp.]|uniref:hypothetical protein n=1 Tax=Candidatus Palauibacter sp. TaxID=3101350 RepID=UPI003AF25D67
MYRDRVSALAPYVSALLAHAAGDTAGGLRLRSSLGEDEAFPVEFFFRSENRMLDFERYALDLCRGRVLDLGAGAGPHTVALQAKKRSVVALEGSPTLARLLKARGADARRRSAFGVSTASSGTPGGFRLPGRIPRPGVDRTELSHAGRVGRPFRELYVDLETLARHAAAAGWRCEVAFEAEDAAYLARLTKSG